MELPKKIGQFSIFGSLGKGGFGDVYVGRDPKTNQTYAIKVSSQKSFLQKEYTILKRLSRIQGFMKVFEYECTEKYDYIVFELLGKNLSYRQNNRILSLRSVAAIGIELLNKIEHMHHACVLHRDIKPSQFLLSGDKRSIYLVDFGMACFYSLNGRHKVFKTKCHLRGSASFASINCHIGFRQSRRDDLESWFYSLVYLLKGELPWRVEQKVNAFAKWKIILNEKVKNQESLFRNNPAEFELIYKYIRRILYDQMPNYDYIRNLLSKFVQPGEICLNFDWILYPQLFLNVTSFVVNDGKSSFLHIQRDDAEFIAKRRDTSIKISDIQKYCSDTDMKIGSTDFDIANNLNTKDLCYLQIDSKDNRKRKSTKAKKFKSCENFDINLKELNEGCKFQQRIININEHRPSLTHEEILLHNSITQECETFRADLPSFQNKSEILEKRKEFVNSYKEKKSQCAVF